MIDFSNMDPSKMTDILLMINDFADTQDPNRMLELSIEKYKQASNDEEKLSYLNLIIATAKSIKKELDKKS